MIPDRERTTGSLFERMEASSARNRQGGSIHSLRQSIRQNLRNILNTRSGSCRGAPELGIDEPEGAENFRESMSRAIEQCIERYEPRISHAEVQAVVSSASSPLDMTFHITAWVTFNETHEVTEQYISDYTATWRAGMDNLNIRNFESIGQLTGALEQVISGDQPLQRALTVLRDNTQPGVFSEKLSAKEREEALAEPDYQLLTRLGHEFAPENSTLAVQKDKESTMQAVYQQLTELHRYLLAIQNAPVPGKSALKAVQLRLDQNSSDPIFATRQMAKTLPAPLNRWVGRLTDQAWHVVMVEAVHYMEVDWRDSVVKPFNEQLANEALKTRAQSSPQLRGWLQTRQDLHAFADLVMQREKEGLTLSYIKNVIWQAERGLGQETPVESLLTQYHDARAQKQNTDALEKQINERLEGVLSRWLLLKNNVMPEAATGTTAEK